MPVLVAALAELVLPRHCVGCGRGGAVFCTSCVPRQRPQVTDLGLAVVAAAPYDGAVRSALLAYKERGRRDLTAPLADLLARCVASARAGPLVPVPSAPAVARSRGGDHVLRLARAAGRRTGVAVVAPLRLTRSVRDSAGLGARARADNLRGAMHADPPRSAAPALLVDDIVTTGATLREAARALAAAGWSVHAAAVVAATKRR